MQTPLHIPSDPAAIPAPARPSGFSSTQASVLLDIVRGLAAVFVLLGHWRNLFFLDYADLPAHRTLFALPYLLTSAGHQAVIVFFVLSGYLISGSVFRMFRAGRWSWRTYLLHRLVRLWVVLLPGLTLAALFDFVGLHLHRQPAIALYTGLSGNHLVEDIRPLLHPSIWLGNLFFLQGTFVPVFGSDGPLWSLANEFWYYLLFPLGLLALHPRTTLLPRLVYALSFGLIAWRLNPAITVLFPVWLLGTLMALLPLPRLSLAWRLLASVLYVPTAFITTKIHLHNTILADLLFGLITFAFLYVLLSARNPVDPQSLPTRLWRTLARFSYTLYVVHLPFLILVAAIVLPRVRWVPDALHLALASSFLVLALAFSYTLAAFTEFRTDMLRKAIERRLPD